MGGDRADHEAAEGELRIALLNEAVAVSASIERRRKRRVLARNRCIAGEISSPGRRRCSKTRIALPWASVGCRFQGKGKRNGSTCDVDRASSRVVFAQRFLRLSFFIPPCSASIWRLSWKPLYCDSSRLFGERSVGQIHSCDSHETSISIGCRAEGFHARRAAGRDCDHRHSGGAVVAGHSGGPRSGPAGELPEHDAPMGHGDAEYHSARNKLPEGNRSNPRRVWVVYTWPYVERSDITRVDSTRRSIFTSRRTRFRTRPTEFTRSRCRLTTARATGRARCGRATLIGEAAATM